MVIWDTFRITCFLYHGRYILKILSKPADTFFSIDPDWHHRAVMRAGIAN